MFDAVRSAVAPLHADRPCGPDAMAAQDALFVDQVARQLRDAVSGAMGGHKLRGTLSAETAKALDPNLKP